MGSATASSLVKLDDTRTTFADPAEDVRGRKVIDATGEEVGVVDSLFIDERETKVRLLGVKSNTFLGIGGDTRLIPVDAVTSVDDEHVHVDQTHEHVRRSPAYDPELERDDSYYGEVYGHYGLAPYWAAGYVHFHPPGKRDDR